MVATPARTFAACLLGAALACAGCDRASTASADAAGDTDAAAGDPAAGAAASTPITVPPPDDGIRSSVPDAIELPPADAATPSLPAGADIVYTCEDGGDLRVTYASGMANVTMADGAIVALAHSPQASSQAGGEVYIGDLHGLRRIGNVVELQQQAGEPRRCREEAASA